MARSSIAFFYFFFVRIFFSSQVESLSRIFYLSSNNSCSISLVLSIFALLRDMLLSSDCIFSWILSYCFLSEVRFRVISFFLNVSIFRKQSLQIAWSGIFTPMTLFPLLIVSFSFPIIFVMLLCLKKGLINHHNGWSENEKFRNCVTLFAMLVFTSSCSDGALGYSHIVWRVNSQHLSILSTEIVFIAFASSVIYLEKLGIFN